MNRSKLFFTTLGQSIVVLIVFLGLAESIQWATTKISITVQPILTLVPLLLITGFAFKKFGFGKYGWSCAIFFAVTTVLSVYNGVDFLTFNGIIAGIVISIAITLSVIAQNMYWVWGIIVPFFLGIIIEKVALIAISLAALLPSLVVVQ
jgi:hypothetical protein